MGIPTQQASRLDSQQEPDWNELSRVVLADTEKAWSKIFPTNDGPLYTPAASGWLYDGGIPPPAVRAICHNPFSQPGSDQSLF